MPFSNILSLIMLYAIRILVHCTEISTEKESFLGVVARNNNNKSTEILKYPYFLNVCIPEDLRVICLIEVVISRQPWRQFKSEEIFFSS